MHRAKPLFPKSATDKPSVFTGTRGIEDRTRPWHSCALLSGLFGALQYISVSTEDCQSITAV